MPQHPARHFLIIFLSLIVLVQSPISNIMAAETVAVAVPSGTPVNLRFDETVSSNSHQVGQSVRVVVQYDVIVQGKTVIKGGTPAQAHVANVTHKSVLGGAGKISVSVDSVPAVDGTILQLGATSRAQGDNQLALALILGLLLCLPILFITGTSGTIESGSVVSGGVASSVSINVSD